MPDPRALPRRSCFECGATIMRGEGGIRAFGRLFCSEDCADIYEVDVSSRDIDEMYPEWSGAMSTGFSDEF